MLRRKPENISGKSDTDIIAGMGVEMTEGYSMKRDRVVGNHKHPDKRDGYASSFDGAESGTLVFSNDWVMSSFVANKPQMILERPLSFQISVRRHPAYYESYCD